MKKSIEKQLINTCKKSDIVFTVSYPLLKKLKVNNEHTNLFLPWAQRRFSPLPILKEIRKNVVLYWGYIDHRIDWNIILYLLKNGILIRFIGSIEKKVKHKIEELKSHDAFEYLDAMPLEQVKKEDVFCSIIPYDVKLAEVNAISMSNRAFQLLSYGIPLVFSDLKDLITAPKEVMLKSRTKEEFFDNVKVYEKCYELSQNYIKLFLENHYSENRYDELMESIL